MGPFENINSIIGRSKLNLSIHIQSHATTLKVFQALRVYSN